MIPDAHAMLRTVAVLASVGVAISTLEFLASAREFRSGGLYDWRIVSQGLVGAWKLGVVDVAFSYPAVMWWMAWRLTAAILILSGAARGWMAPGLYVSVAVTSFALAWRVPFGLEGAEQMLRIVFSVLSLTSLAPASVPVQSAALWFLALQACLAYLTAGLAKSRVPAWRDGSFLRGILGTRSYGNRAILRLLGSGGRARICSLAVMGFECLFPLVLLAGRPWALVFLAAGVAFHAFNALVLGLNVFFWAFVATYPAVWYCTR